MERVNLPTSSRKGYWMCKDLRLRYTVGTDCSVLEQSTCLRLQLNLAERLKPIALILYRQSSAISWFTTNYMIGFPQIMVTS